MSSTRPHKRAREDADEGMDKASDEHVRKYQAIYQPATSYPAAAQNMWNRTTAAPQSSKSSTRAPDTFGLSSGLFVQAQYTMDTSPARPTRYGSNRNVWGVTPPQSVPVGNPTASLQQISNPRPRSRLSNAPSAASYSNKGAVAPMSLNRRVVQQQYPWSEGPTALQSSLHAPAQNLGTSAQHRGYHPNIEEKHWFDTTAHQLQRPYRFIPGIPMDGPVLHRDRLLYPYEVLGISYLPPRDRYIQYAYYNNLLATVYGSVPKKTPEEIAAITAELRQISSSLNENEQQHLQHWQGQGISQEFRQDRQQAYTLADVGLSNVVLLDAFSSSAVVGPQVTHPSSIPRTPGITRQQDAHGSMPALYMPNPSRLSSQALGDPHVGHSSSAQAVPTTTYAYSRGGESPLQVQPSSTGYYDPPANRSIAVATNHVERLPMQHRQHGNAVQGGNSSAPIVIDDEDDQSQPLATSQRSPGLNPAVKRRRSIMEARPAKIPRTTSYTRPADLFSDSGEAVTASHGLQASVPVPQAFSPGSQNPSPVPQSGPSVHKTFEGSKDFQEYEDFLKNWEANKQKVENSIPGQLDHRLARDNNRGIFKHDKPWMAFNAARKGEWEAKEKAKQKAKEKEEKLKARRAREAAMKKEQRRIEQAEKQRAVEQKARQQQRRQEKETASHEAMGAIPNSKQTVDVTGMSPWAAAEKIARMRNGENEAVKVPHQQQEQGLPIPLQHAEASSTSGCDIQTDQFDNSTDNDEEEWVHIEAMFLKQLQHYDHQEDQLQPSCDTHTGVKQAVGNGDQEVAQSTFEDEDDMASLFGDAEGAIDTTPTSAEDNDDMASLFGDEGEIDTPPTSPEYSQAFSKRARNEASEAVAKVTPTTEPSAETNVAQSEQTEAHRPATQKPEDPTAGHNDEGAGVISEDSGDEEEDPEIAAKYAPIRLLDEQIAEKSAQLLNSSNALFRTRVEKSIDKLVKEKQILEIEIDGGL